jgi:hypothetical protein
MKIARKHCYCVKASLRLHLKDLKIFLTLKKSVNKIKSAFKSQKNLKNSNKNKSLKMNLLSEKYFLI